MSSSDVKASKALTATGQLQGFIGSGAVLREGLNLPPNTVISAGKRVMGWPIQEESN